MNSTWNIRPGWSPVTISIMVVGFIIAWPLGLAALAYIIWGDRIHTFVDEARYKWSSNRAGESGNVAFDDYRERELKRLEEEPRKLDTMREEFDRFMHELRRAKDKEEFDRFMSERGRHESKGFETAAPSGASA
jgi:hypothetical protein